LLQTSGPAGLGGYVRHVPRGTGSAEQVEHLPPHRQWTPLARALSATGDNWTLLIILQLAPGPVRLARLRKRLPGVSSGVLDRHLRQMHELGLLSSTRFRERPPRVELELTERGRELLPIAGAMMRWGWRHLWSAPKVGEAVDIGTLLRLLPVLLEEHTDLQDGAVELFLEDPVQPIHRLFTIEHGHLCSSDAAPGTASAQLAGDERAWSAALGPMHNYSGLRHTGSEPLVRQLLDALHD
jgi:DNA-binding HxlR family transcriptional regulator